jgi:hypothetical protein
MPIYVLDFLKELDQERIRGAIIHATPEKGAAVTQFAQKTCLLSKGKYFDLLSFFIEHQELAQIIDRFGPENLRKLLIEQSQSFPLLIVDRADFLLDTWTRSERQDFFRMIKDQWDGYKDGMKAKLIFCLQTSQEIEALKILNSQGESRVRQLTDFNDIL